MSGKPAIKILLPFLCGIVLGKGLHPPLLPLSLVLTLLVLVAFLARPEKLFGIFALSALVLAGALRVEWPEQRPAVNDVRRLVGSSETICLQGLIKSPVERNTWGQRFILQADSAWVAGSANPVSGHTAVTFYDTSLILQQGDLVLFKGVLRHLTGSRNPGGFDEAGYWALRGVYSRYFVRAHRSLVIARDQDGFFTRECVRPCRLHIEALIDASSTGRQRALLLALILGERRDLDKDIRRDLTATGVIHVLSVSGLHVGFVVLAMVWGLRLGRVARKWRWPFLLVGLFFYGHLTGAAAPVVRAAIMATVMLMAPCFQRRHQPLNNIALAAFIILALQPLELFSPGFQLSFTAVIGIVVLYQKFSQATNRHLSRWREQGRYFTVGAMQLAMVSLAAQIATVPLTAYYFNVLPLYALAANLFIVPLASVIVMAGFAAVVASLFSGSLALLILSLDDLLLDFLVLLVSQFARLPLATVVVPAPSFWLIAVYFLSLCVFVFWRQEAARRHLIAALGVLVTIWMWHGALTSGSRLRVTFFDVGQGDAALCEFPGGHTLLIDAGDANEKIDYGERVIVPYLHRQGIRRLDVVLITHGHSDHLGGVMAVLQALPVGRLISSACTTDRSLYNPIDSLCCRRSIVSRQVAAGDTLAGFPGANLLILGPNHARMEQVDENSCSIVIKLDFGERTFLFTGDMTADSTAFSGIDRVSLRGDVVKIPHHGSALNNPAWLIEQCRAQYGVISVGRYNQFNLPSADALAAWEEARCEVVRTDEAGAVVFITDGKNLDRQ